MLDNDVMRAPVAVSLVWHSMEFHVAPHLIRRAALMDEQQHLQRPPDGVLLLVAVANAGMLDAAACENEEIVVMGDDDAPVGQSVRDVIFVGSP